MKVLVITSLYLPDVAANAKRMHQFATHLVSRGHEVTILSAVPHYPHGRIQEGWRRKPFSVSFENGMKVVRVWVYASPGRRVWQKAMNYISFLGMSLPAVSLTGRNYDIIVSISPPLLSGLSAYYFSRLCRCPFIFDVEDLYPETAIQLGVLKGKKAIAFFEALEKFIYRKSASCAVISAGFRRSLLKKGVTADKVAIIPNWADTSVFSPDVTPVDKRVFGLGDRFVVIFLGTVGRAQGCEVIIEAATILRDHQNIGFCLLGDGVELPKLQKTAKARNLDNVTFIDPVPHNEVPHYLAAADACLVHLVAKDLYKVTLPSKIYEYMAIGRPILMGVEGEAAKLISESASGITFAPEKPEQLANKVILLASDPEQCARLGWNGRQYCKKYYSQDHVLMEYEKLLRRELNHPLNT